MARVDFKARAAAEGAAADIVKAWTDEQLELALPAQRLAASWGLALDTVRELVRKEQLARRVAKAPA